MSSKEGASLVPNIQTISAKRFSITPTSKRRTRQRVSLEDMNIAQKWTNDFENDFTDFIGKWFENERKTPNNEYNMPIFYRIMNLLLSLLQGGGSQDRKYFAEDITAIKHAAEQVGFDIDTDNIIKHLILNTLHVYEAVNRFPKASTIDEFKQDKVSQIILYHGFKDRAAPIIEKINKLNQNDQFITPIFLSTSVLHDVACRFSDSGHILLKIIVHSRHFEDCPYAYLGKSLVIGETNSDNEHEVLLNLFTKFKYISKTTEEITYNVPQILGAPLEKTEEFIVYTMEYVENSSKTREQINEDLIKLVNEYSPS
jgi:hypothetical protein